MFIYKTSELDETKFLDSIFKSLSKKTSEINIEIELNRLISNPNLDHLNNLMFLHWYERRFKKNVINENVLTGLNPSNKYLSKRTIEDEIIDRHNQYMHSSRFENYTIYYEYYFDFFPEIEKLTFEEFSGRYFYDYLIELFPTLNEIDFKSQKKFFRFKQKSKPLKSEYYYSLSYKSNNLPSFYPFKKGEKYTYTPNSLLTIKKNEIANEVRVEKGLPKIGEGWISETRLYYSIKEEFDFTDVIHHASPNWLGKQHFDIYLPEFNIAIEYQGIQHSQPVEFFGGIEGFKKNQERDLRKQRLCLENNCILFYAYPNDEHFEIISQIKKALNSI